MAETKQRRSSADICSGVIFGTIGAAFVIAALPYGFGEGGQIGAALFPVMTGSVLLLLGLAIAVRGLLRGDAGAVGRLPWGLMGLVSAALVAFVLLIDTFEAGLVPATFVAAFIAGLTTIERPLTLRKLLSPLLTAAGITVLCVLVFYFALQLNLDLFG
ncbi:tripartite tricarboxylate transporter TctB family protein [Naumannella halotolerans]|uniref:Tripartite tricarboxylate transporter TctB family protein n=1 Tax=Naumannella halotolerans TaxID=993414 RepID=A0A4R7J4I2_9ACTN|nr:tripartite tricarboxylate transporter TctB family protein [Naumannella halotolerans]